MEASNAIVGDQRSAPPSPLMILSQTYATYRFGFKHLANCRGITRRKKQQNKKEDLPVPELILSLDGFGPFNPYKKVFDIHSNTEARQIGLEVVVLHRE